MHKPLHTLIFGSIAFLLLGCISWIVPENGTWNVHWVSLRFFSLKKLVETKAESKRVQSIITVADELSEKSNISKEKKDSISKLVTHIQYSNANALKYFFDALKCIKSEGKQIRVLHYGDSQIEGDRITDYLRLKLQGLFGGEGPGLISLMPVSPSVTNKMENGPGWDRYSIYTFKDPRVKHDNYGVMGGFARYAEYKNVNDTSKIIQSDITVSTTKFGGSNAMAYKKIKLFYGGAKEKTWCEFYDGPALVSADSLVSGGNMNVKEYHVGQGSFRHTLKFSGKDSPDFYAMSLESNKGIMVDNIPQRGSSGTFFHQINPVQLKTFFNYLNVKLIILQYGGNVLPSITDASMAANYGTYIKYQLSVLKKSLPTASILFIGPSDMSVKQGTEYLTHPYLEDTRNAIRKAVLESDCAFFDLYDCMGGKNSMPAWVEEKLAATDYTHFSPQGARKMATLLYTALINEYHKYEKK